MRCVEKSWLPMERMISLILLLVRLVFRSYKSLVVFGHTVLVVFRQVPVWDSKSVRRARVGRAWGAGQVICFAASLSCVFYEIIVLNVVFLELVLCSFSNFSCALS